MEMMRKKEEKKINGKCRLRWGALMENECLFFNEMEQNVPFMRRPLSSAGLHHRPQYTCVCCDDNARGRKEIKLKVKTYANTKHSSTESYEEAKVLQSIFLILIHRKEGEVAPLKLSLKITNTIHKIDNNSSASISAEINTYCLYLHNQFNVCDKERRRWKWKKERDEKEEEVRKNQ